DLSRAAHASPHHSRPFARGFTCVSIRSGKSIEMEGRRCRKLLLAELLLRVRVVVRLTANRTVSHQWVRHPILDRWRHATLLTQMHEYVGCFAIVRLAVDNDVEMHVNKLITRLCDRSRRSRPLQGAQKQQHLSRKRGMLWRV